MALFAISGQSLRDKSDFLKQVLANLKKFSETDPARQTSTSDPAGYYNRLIDAARSSGLSDDVTFGMLGTGGSSLAGRININDPFFRDLSTRSFVTSPGDLAERLRGIRGAFLDASTELGDIGDTTVTTMPVDKAPDLPGEEDQLLSDPLIKEEVEAAKKERARRISLRTAFLNLPSGPGNLLTASSLTTRFQFLGG